jgi:inward rectifier potassium channel
VSAVEEHVSEDVNADLGFGTVVTRESRRRLLNRDGSFNVHRDGLRFWESLSAYHYFLTMSWTKFLGWIIGAYIIVNALFATVYVLLGSAALHGGKHDFASAFFFSIHTLATIGYGNVSPVSFAANVVVAVESLVGLIGFAIVYGFVFARFARPTACIRFSAKAVIAPYKDGRAFMFRIVNQRESQIVNLGATVLLSRRKKGGVTRVDREFVQLKLERESVVFFPLAWTIVHPIDAESPLRHWTAADLMDCDAEFLILLNGFDETFSQTVHTRSSYAASEVVWGARFRSMFNPPEEDGTITVDIRKLHEIEQVPIPAG